MADSEEVSLVDEVTKLVAKEPFVPFTVVMTSASRYEISARDTVVPGKSVLTLMLHAGVDHLLRNNQISEVTVPAEARYD